MTTQHLMFRLLRKLNVLPYLNITKTISYAGHSVTIPVVKGLGYPNLFLKSNWLYPIINQLFTTDSEGFVDVGANIGQTLIAVKTASRPIQYVGIEPSVSCCYYLKNLIHTNEFSGCRVYNVALSDTLKETILETNGEADPTGSIVTALRPAFFSRREAVFSIDYDRISIDQKVTCVKIDVEGGELETLLGMQTLIARDRPYILCEILDSFSDDVLAFTQNRADSVCALLNQHDYRIIQLIQNEQTDRIIAYKELEVVPIRQWDKQSLELNDYLFVPAEKRSEAISALETICR